MGQHDRGTASHLNPLTLYLVPVRQGGVRLQRKATGSLMQPLSLCECQVEIEKHLSACLKNIQSIVNPKVEYIGTQALRHALSSEVITTSIQSYNSMYIAGNEDSLQDCLYVDIVPQLSYQSYDISWRSPKLSTVIYLARISISSAHAYPSIPSRVSTMGVTSGNRQKPLPGDIWVQ